MSGPMCTALAEKPAHGEAVMRLRVVLLGTLVVCLLCIVLAPASARADSVVTFPDAGLNGAMHYAVGKALADPILQSDLATLTVLHADGWSITNLDGLEHATSLQVLTLHDNTITTITPLASLTNLTFLGLDDNTISDLDPLKNLTGLDELDLYDNQISNVDALKTLTGLEVLALSGNQISDVDPLTTLTSLRRLYIGVNQIATVTPLASLTDLTDIDLHDNQIVDMSPLSSLTNMRRMWIGDNANLSDIGAVSSMPSLIYLDFSGSDVSSIGPLAGRTMLASVIGDLNHVSDLTPLHGLHALSLVEFQSNDIADVSPLQGMTNLQELYLGDNQISDVTGLTGLPKLNTLYLWGNDISNVAPLAALGGLHHLLLQDNEMWDISPLAGLPLDKQVDVASNWLDFTPGSAASQTADAWLAFGLPENQLYIYPQRTGGAMVGTVRSTHGALLSGAAVVLSFGPSASTASGGTYSIRVVPTHDQTITVSKLRYTSVTTTRSVSAGVTQTVDTTLAPILSMPTLKRSPSSSSLTYKRKKGVAKFTLSATLSDPFGPLSAAYVWLQKSSNGKKWSTLYKLKTNGSGRVSRALSTKKKGTTYYRWYAPATEVDRSAATGKQKVVVK